jgi:hypothetical protein
LEEFDMAQKSALLGSLGSLLDTLGSRFDPFQPPAIRARWLAATAHAAAAAGDADWGDLPDDSDRYDEPIRLVDRATRSLVMADYSDSNSVNAALDDVELAGAAVGALVLA